ncbi:cytochrome P450 [Tuberibacillus sp. Marseille-P3662]|uniref:cytochrome P450 n=1 Tax=Tuberibacillus sp. Marseille-P3662 TaxID=1965358 RepID=UPI000A1C81A7|nr:cytochrome P450 [Tuberibacillus sp. Marseille-P3662]
MTSNSKIPREKVLDNSLALMSEGYLFIQNRCRRYGTDIFQTRLMGGQRTICMSGAEAARTFYDNDRFKRKGAVPKRIQKTLFGKGAIQTMDEEAHKHRKALFMSLMTSERLQGLTDITREKWEEAISQWMNKDRVVFFKETQEIMCRTACHWAGVPLEEKEVTKRADDLGALVDAFGAVGPRHWRGRRARARTNKWVKAIIQQVRAGKLNPAEKTALYAMSWHRDLNGKLLNSKMAAIELINILRPIVAIGRYITFGALALHEHPEEQKKLEADETDYSQMFVQEVRRYYPFGPFIGARVRKGFIWRQHRFKKGTLVLLDLYGTNHDPSLWEEPDQFHPERFSHWKGSPFDFIPQGGGDYDMGHRCAGEWVTVKVMKESLDFLTQQVNYDVPDQDLSFSMVRMPSIPESRFVIGNVRRKHS